MHLGEALPPEVGVDGPEDGGADLEDGGHLLGADPEVTDVQEELLAQVPADGEVVGGAHHLHRLAAHLVPAGGPLILRRNAPHHDGRLQARPFDGLEGLLTHLLLVEGGLDHPRGVPDHHEGEAAAAPGPVHPAPDLHLPPGEAAPEDLADGHPLGHGHASPRIHRLLFVGGHGQA